jgi:hypothetical protein
MSFGKYKLNDDGTVEPFTDVIEWAGWYETASNRQIALDDVGDVRISTVFLSIDHSFGGDGPPILFETMIFPAGEILDRYSTAKQALAGHRAYVRLEKEKLHRV